MIRACLLGGHSRSSFDYGAYFSAARALLAAGQIQIVHRGPRGLSEKTLKNVELWLVWPDFGLGMTTMARPGHVSTMPRLKAIGKNRIVQLPFDFDELDLQDRLDPVLRSMGQDRVVTNLDTEASDQEKPKDLDIERIALSMLVEAPWISNEEGGERIQAEHGTIAYKGAAALRKTRNLLGIQRKIVRGGTIRIVIDPDKFDHGSTGLMRFDPRRLPEKVKLSYLERDEAVSHPPVPAPARGRGTRNRTADIRPSDMTGIRLVR